MAVGKHFKVHRLNDKGLRQADELAHRFQEVLDFCELVATPGRELSLVATKLEEACFFAKKALAINPENQLAPPTE